MSKDVIVVSSWPTVGLAALFQNWTYVVLVSRVCTLSGLYLVEPIGMEKSFQTSQQPAIDIAKMYTPCRRHKTTKNIRGVEKCV
jgi:hypothetical protein